MRRYRRFEINSVDWVDKKPSCRVYIISCSECELSYVVRTGKDLRVRVQQQMGECTRHSFETLHTINGNCSRLLCKSSDEFKKLTVESSLIMHVLHFILTLGSTWIYKFSGKIIQDPMPLFLNNWSVVWYTVSLC